MTPAEYVNEIAVPTLRDFRDDRRSRRRAYLACIAVFHVKDHLKKAGERNVEGAIRSALPNEFDVVRGVCNGTKHVETDASHPIAFKAGDDWYRPPAVAGLFVVGLSALGDAKGGREIRSANARHDLYSSAKMCLQTFVALYPGRVGACDLSDC